MVTPIDDINNEIQEDEMSGFKINYCLLVHG